MVAGFTVTGLAEPQRQTDRQTGRQAGRQTDNPSNTKKDRQTDGSSVVAGFTVTCLAEPQRQTERQASRQAGRQTDNQILKKKKDGQTNKLTVCRFHSDRPCRTTATNKQTDRQTSRQVGRQTINQIPKKDRQTNRLTVCDPSVVAGFTVAETGLARGEALTRTALLGTANRLEHESRAD